MSDAKKPAGPDFTKGVRADQISEGAMLVGHVGGQPVLIARSGGSLYAIDAECTHYHGPLAEGLIVGHTVRCPWHHACFSLKTGEAIAAPAFDPVGCWTVDQKGGQAFVRAKKDVVARRKALARTPSRVVIIGGGAAGFAAAEMLRRQGFAGQVVLLSADSDPPYDRPNCSKDYLAGAAPKDWMPLRDAAFYKNEKIDIHVNTEVASFDAKAKTVSIKDGVTLVYDILILATGAEPRRPTVPGLSGPTVFVLRTLSDADALIAAADGAKQVAVVGASFIGLEVAGALKQRGLDVHVIAPETTPLDHVLGGVVGEWVRGVHEKKGVVFHLGRKVVGYADGKVAMDQGESVQADFVVVGVGVSPRVSLAEAAGLKTDNGVVTDDHLKTSADGVYAAGDIARYPDPISGELIRVEHWVHAARQGQYLARLILGEDRAFADPPYFWSSHYDKTVSYCGHAEAFDSAEIEGSVAKEDAAVRYMNAGQLLAIATLGRDLANLKAEEAFETPS